MVVKIRKGIVNMDFTTFPVRRREEKFGQLQYNKKSGMPQTTATCVEHISLKVKFIHSIVLGIWLIVVCR